MWLAHWLLTVTIMAQSGSGTAAAAPAMPEPVVARQHLFAIPFQVGRVDDPARQPVELQLYVSGDRGAHWTQYAKAPPTQKHFMFRAGADGEFWFAIRTIDRSGQSRPETINTPGLRVVVDTRSSEPKPLAQRTQSGLTPVSADAAVRAKTAAQLPRGEKPAANADSLSNTEPRGSVAVAINPAVGSRFADPNDRHGSAVAIAGLPPGERPRMVNSRMFELEYDVDSVGPSGIGRVELWGTRDGGKSWRRFVVDEGGRSPMKVSVDEEGVYGFRVVVTNGAGLGGAPPKVGDLPDLWIGVDLIKPTARIVSAQQGTDTEAANLIISWQADDKMLAARPVSLSFSTSRGGPWLPIASGLENTGRYAWPVDSRTPPQFYLQLEVRDEAGNVAVHETSEPVAIDQARPTVRVRDVHPLRRP
jgi:hypothetical protein